MCIPAGGDAAETIINEDVAAEKRAVRTLAATKAVGSPCAPPSLHRSSTMKQAAHAQVDDAKEFIKHRVVEKMEAKQIPHKVRPGMPAALFRMALEWGINPTILANAAGGDCAVQDGHDIGRRGHHGARCHPGRGCCRARSHGIRAHL